MKIIFEDFEKVKNLKISAITVGSFDGIHKGHIRIIKELEKEKPNMLITFSPHPKVFIESKKDFVITLEEEKIKILENFDIDYLLFLKFNESFKNLSYLEFLFKIKEKFSPSKWIVGPDHFFGKERKGNSHKLWKFCIENGIALTILPYEKFEDKKISSSLLRYILKKGEVEKYIKLTGRNYEIQGIVIEGEKVGREMGFPTANIKIKEEKILPKEGVYAGEVIYKNKIYKAGISVGENPTFGKDKRNVEIHIIGFLGNIYGEKLKVIFKKFLREKQKFERIEDLKKKIKEDIEKIKEVSYGKRSKAKNY